MALMMFIICVFYLQHALTYTVKSSIPSDWSTYFLLDKNTGDFYVKGDLQLTTSDTYRVSFLLLGKMDNVLQ